MLIHCSYVSLLTYFSSGTKLNCFSSTVKSKDGPSFLSKRSSPGNYSREPGVVNDSHAEARGRLWRKGP